MGEVDDDIEKVAIELVEKLRRLHFQHGSAKTERTRRIKDVIETNSVKIYKDAT